MIANKAEPVGFEELKRRALELEAEQKLVDARDAFDGALRMNPSSQSAAEGRARVALALREDSAIEHCARALAFHHTYPDRQLRMIATVAAELGCAAIPLFEDYVRQYPDSPTAHQLLADLRAENGAGDSFTESYVEALSKAPGNKPLLLSYWNTLTRAGRINQALDSMDANRSLFEGERDFALLEANIANHAGMTDRAGRVLLPLDDHPDVQLARGQYRLQIGNPEEAARLLESVIVAEPNNFEAWSLLEVAWRLTGDRRHEWLVGQPGLYGASELPLDGIQLAGIASTLRSMHLASAQPIGQSVRGGTQTSGQLFLRHDPDITLLTNALRVAIRQFVDDLPAADPHHPLLKYRNMGMTFGPSWSVRFTDKGHHAAHFHPGGILSSALYICVPDSLADKMEKPGWLELGRPPVELGLDLEPIATFEPKPSRLVLFPSYLFHGTRPISGGERLSVAFDLVPVPMS